MKSVQFSMERKENVNNTFQLVSPASGDADFKFLVLLPLRHYELCFHPIKMQTKARQYNLGRRILRVQGEAKIE